MPTKTFKKGLLGLEDFYQGAGGTFTRTTSTGGTQTLTKVSFAASPPGLTFAANYTSTGTVTAPSTAPTFSDESAGGSISAGTYYAKVAYVTRNGETTCSPAQTLVLGSGSRKVLCRQADNNWFTGAYGFRVYASNDNVNFYRQTGATLSVSASADGTNMTITAATRTSNITIVTCSAGLGSEFQVGRPVVISGCDASFNGTFRILSIGGDGYAANAATPTQFSYYNAGSNGSSGAVGNARVFSACCDGTIAYFRTAANSLFTGKSVTTSGYGNASFNGTFTVREVIDNQTFTATLALAAAQTNGGTVAWTSTLDSDPTVHWITGDFIMSTLTFSGTAAPTTNTATIDSVQVALNAMSASINAPRGILVLQAADTALTTPLICTNQQAILGLNAPRIATGAGSYLTASWADPELAAVMVCKASSFKWDGIAISSAGHGLMILGTSVNHHYSNGSIITSGTTGKYSAVRILSGTGSLFSLNFDDIYLAGDRACVMVSHCVGTNVRFRGCRWDGNSLLTSTSGPNSSHLLSEGGADDFDRNATSVGGGITWFQLEDLFTESGTGISFDARNIGLAINNVFTSDTSTVAGTPCVIRVSADSFGGGQAWSNIIKNFLFESNGNLHSSFSVTQHTSSLLLKTTFIGCRSTNTRFFNANGISMGLTLDSCSGINSYSAATTGKFVNLKTTSGDIAVLGSAYDGTSNSSTAMQKFPGGILYNKETNPSQFFYEGWTGGNTMVRYLGDPATAANYAKDWTSNSGYGERIFQNDGSTVLFQVNAQSGANQVNIGNPTNNANNSCALGVNLRTDKIVTVYNGIATVKNGVPSEYATIDTTGLTANVGASTLYAVPAAGEGMYRVSAYTVLTVAGSVSSTLPNVQIVYTDKDSNTSVTLNASPNSGGATLGQSAALTANTVGLVAGGVTCIYVKASTTIQYQTVNYASNAAGMTYALRIRLEAI